MSWRTGTRLAVITITVLAILLAIALSAHRHTGRGCTSRLSTVCLTPAP